MLRWLITSCLFGLALAATQELQVEYSLGDETALMTVTVDRKNHAIHYHLPEGDSFEEVQVFQDYETGYAASKVEIENVCFVRELDMTLEEQVEYLENNRQYTITDSVNTTAIPLGDDEQSDVGHRVIAFCDGFPIYELIFDDEAVRDDSSSEEDSDESSGSGSGSESDESDSGSGSESDESDSGSSSEEDTVEEEATRRSLRDSSEESSVEETGVSSPDRRQVSVTYRRCVLLFLVFKCFVTTLTIPTGGTIIFPWIIIG